MSTRTTAALESVYVLRGAVPSDAIADSLHALLPARHHPIPRQRLILLDTFDGRVRRAGARLTRNGKRGSSLMAWQPRGAGIHTTVRLNSPVGFAWDLPDGPMQQALTPVVGVRRLLPQAEIEEHGSLLDVLDASGKTVARVRIESGRARLAESAAAWTPLPVVITLTGLRGYAEAYERLVPVIQSRPGIEACADSFHGITLQQVGAPAGRAATLSDLGLSPAVRADAGARQVHLALLDVLAANESGVRERIDTEFLHDFRVAVRRTRSLLGQIKRVFAPESAQHFASELSWLGGVTGPPRDLDVLLLRMRHYQQVLDDGQLEAVTSFLNQVQQREHRTLIDALDSDRYRRLLADWRAFLSAPAQVEPAPVNATKLLSDVVSRRAWRLSRRIADSAVTLDGDTSPAQLHETRVTAKKLRYLVDVTPTFYEEAALRRVLTALKHLQRVLGDFNDAEVQAHRLLEYRRELPLQLAAPRSALATLAELSGQRGEALRAAVSEALQRFVGDETWSACRLAFRRKAAVELTS